MKWRIAQNQNVKVIGSACGKTFTCDVSGRTEIRHRRKQQLVTLPLLNMRNEGSHILDHFDIACSYVAVRAGYNCHVGRLRYALAIRNRNLDLHSLSSKNDAAVSTLYP
jgi:hypothetical protein